MNDAAKEATQEYSRLVVPFCHLTVLETAGVPVTGGPPMLISNAVYFSDQMAFCNYLVKFNHL